MDESNIPVMDFSSCFIDKQDWDPSTCDKEVKYITDAFKNIGFVYLTNHGITQEQVMLPFFTIHEERLYGMLVFVFCPGSAVS